jgi:hypothetical protein
MSKARSGGGATMNKNRSVGVKAGPPSTNKISPKGVSQIGTTVVREAVEKVNVDTMPQVKSGNAVAASTVAGPGGSRTIYPRGTQSQHGSPARGEMNRAPDVPASAKGRDILSSFGPEVSGRGRR